MHRFASGEGDDAAITMDLHNGLDGEDPIVISHR
jgi:hypothetical protein